MKWLTVEEAAARLGYGYRFTLELARSGQLSGAWRQGRAWRIPRRAVEEYWRPERDERVMAERHAQMLELYRAGMGCREIAARFGVHPETVRRQVRRAGLSRGRVRRREVWTDGQRMELAHYFLERGLRLREEDFCPQCRYREECLNDDGPCREGV